MDVVIRPTSHSCETETSWRGKRTPPDCSNVRCRHLHQMLIQTPERREETTRLLYRHEAEYAKLLQIRPISHQYRVAPPIAINILDKPDEESNDLSSDPVSVRLQPKLATKFNAPPVNAPASTDFLTPHQMCVPPFSDRHERPLAIERVVLIAPTIASDNTQGKSSRYKPVAKHQSFNSSISIAVSNPVINTRRHD